MDSFDFKSEFGLIDYLKSKAPDLQIDKIGKRYKVGKEGEKPKIIKEYSVSFDFISSFKREHSGLIIKDIGAIFRIRNNNMMNNHIEVFKFDSDIMIRWHFVGNNIDYNFIVDLRKEYYNIHAPIKAFEAIKYKEYIYKPSGFRNNKGAVEKIPYGSQATLLIDLINNALLKNNEQAYASRIDYKRVENISFEEKAESEGNVTSNDIEQKNFSGFSRQIPFTKHEAALLLDAFLETIISCQSRNQIVKRVSDELRKIASNRGVVIDSAYRNTNGISYQMYSMESAYLGRTVQVPATSLFKEIVKLYRENKIEFDLLLKEARAMTDKKKSYEESFAKWLSERVAPEQIVRLWPYFNEIEVFCLKCTVLKHPLFETSDIEIVKKVRNTIYQNKLFKVTHKKQMKNYISAIQLYMAFFKEQKNSLVCNEKSTTSSSKNNSTNNTAEAEKNEGENIGIDEIVASFDGTQDYGYTKPLWFRYKNQDRESVSTWVKLYTSLMRRLAEDYPDVFVADLSLLRGDRIDLAKKTESYKLRRFTQLTDDLLIEINISANGFMKRIAAAASMMGITSEDIEIHYTKRIGERRGRKSENSSINDNRTLDLVVTELIEQVGALIRDSADGITKDEICKKFSNCSTHQINLALETCHAVLILKKYYHRDNICDYQEMADILLEVISKQFSQNGNYTSAQQLYNEARPRLDDFFFYNNAFDSRQEVYDFAVHLFEQEKYKGYSFIFLNNMHIWKEEPDYPKDFHGLLIKYARDRGNVFTREAALAYLDQIGSAAPAQTFSNVMSNMGSKSFLQYDENKFVLAEALYINEFFIAYVSSQIENLLEGEDYIAMGEIDDYFYTTLPKLPSGIYWSALLLEDVLRIYETDFTTIEAGKDNDKKTVPAAIVRKKSHYRTFSDVVWNEISKSFPLPKEFAASEFREFLLNKGFIRGSEKMWNVHKTVAGDIRFYWTDNNGRVTIN